MRCNRRSFLTPLHGKSFPSKTHDALALKRVPDEIAPFDEEHRKRGHGDLWGK